jgi:MoaA/NifB/PqqE/SkfB family radical SAM enzyme
VSVPTIGVEVKVTDRCNQRCRFCMNHDGPERGAELERGWLLPVLRDWARAPERAGARLVELRMTGGEPLLCPATVEELARGCSELGVTTGINTNATLLDRATAERLRAAGLEIVKASLDTTEGDGYVALRGPPKRLPRSLAGMRNAVAVGLRLMVRFTLSALNQRQLLPCYREACDLGAERFQVKPLICAGRAQNEGAFLSPAETSAALEALRREAIGAGVAVEVLCLPGERAGGLRSTTCGSGRKIYVDTAGEVTICNYAATMPTLGNLRVDPVERVLQRRLEQLVAAPDGAPVPIGCPQWPDRGPAQISMGSVQRGL